MDRVLGVGKESGSGSDLSDLSALENETDDFGRRILQHQRDQFRSSNAIQGNQPFRKARPLPRTVRRTQSDDVGAGVLGQPFNEHEGSEGSNDSEPPLNVPQGWGRRRKPLGDWSRHSPDLENGNTVSAPVKDDDRLFVRKTSYTGDDSPRFKRYSSHDGFLPSVETTPPSMERNRRRDVTPSSMQHMNTTIQQIVESDDQDFTAASLLASTPAVNNRNRRIDRLNAKEISALEQKGITQRELRKLSMNGDESRPASARSSEQPLVNEPVFDISPKKENSRPNSKSGGLADFTSAPVTFKNVHRPDHKRADSINLLRKLARVSSQSPSPAPADKRNPDSLAVGPQVKFEDVSVKQEDHERDQLRSRPTAAQQPRSALADILAQVRDQPDGFFGDATIESLNDIVNPDMDRTDTGTFDVSSARSQQNGSPMPRSEEEHLQSLEKHLRKASNSVQDADRGLRRAENRFDTVQSTQNSREADTTARPIIRTLRGRIVQPSKQPKRDAAVCEHCGNVRGSVWYALWLETRSLFYFFNDSDSWSSIRLTRLGTTLFAWLIWYIAESIMCSFFCQPLYASSMVGFGVDPNAPDFPFVIPTLLFRPFRWIWAPVLDVLAWSFGVLFQYLLGDSASYSDPFYMGPSGTADAWMESATATAFRAAQSVADAVDDMGSSWNDGLW